MADVIGDRFAAQHSSKTIRLKLSAGRVVTSSQDLGGLRFAVPLRKGSAGAGLQGALEAYSAVFVRELDGDHDLRGPIARCVSAAARIVSVEPFVEVTQCEKLPSAPAGEADDRVDRPVEAGSIYRTLNRTARPAIR
jgi:hypothetical protein